MPPELSANEMLESVRSETPAESPAPATSPEPSAPQQSPFNPDEIEYTIEGGKTIKENLEMLKKRAGMGYHYAQQMALINQEREKYKGYDEKMSALEKWKQYDEYAAKDPEWAKHVEESWNNRANLQQSNTDGQNTLIQELQAKISELSKFKDEFVSEKEKIRYEAEDKQFVSEIETVGKKFGVDFTLADEQGRSLEWRTLETMKEMGLDGSKPGHFEMAFKHMYFDNLVGKSKEQAKEQVVNQNQEMRKAGILGVSRTPPAKTQGQGFNPKTQSWDDARNFALRDLQAAGKR